jgi:2-dehydro-3-deoxyphosphooctonate aldolase (KDO 8-P synthase)
MAAFGTPVIFDATHSAQLADADEPERVFAPFLARAAAAVGVAGIFIETHQDPDNAPSDGRTMIRLSDMPALLERLVEIDALVKGG